MSAVLSQPKLIEAAWRAAVVQQAHALNRNGLSVGTSGNVSARRGDGFVTTPSGRGIPAAHNGVALALLDRQDCLMAHRGMPALGETLTRPERA